jgi:type IV secretory pathway protease TraF
MLLLSVGVCALAAHLVGAAKFTVIGGEDYNRRAIEAVGLYFFEQPNQMAVAIPDAVEVVVLQNPPSTATDRAEYLEWLDIRNGRAGGQAR